jgi:hypothetical protein
MKVGHEPEAVEGVARVGDATGAVGRRGSRLRRSCASSAAPAEHDRERYSPSRRHLLEVLASR